MRSLIKPMKAPSKSVHMLLKDGDLSKLQFPLRASYKFDGVRATIQNGVVYSNTLKPLPNKHVQMLLGGRPGGDLDGLDGELVVGPPNAPDVFRKTMSGVMSHDGEPTVRFLVFDDISSDALGAAYEERYEVLQDWWDCSKNETIFHDREKAISMDLCDVVEIVEQKIIHNVKELLAFEEEALQLGYEGVMLRDPRGYYKEGPARATLKEGQLLKLKRFEDSEAVVLGLVEAQTNTNAAKKNDLGQTKRSSHKDGKIAKGTLGAIIAKDIHTGQEIKVSTGTLTKEQRAEWWEKRETMRGTLFVYKFFPSGGKDLPRHPTFKGLRDEMDITKKGKK